jgi:hypothetical protein
MPQGVTEHSLRGRGGHQWAGVAARSNYTLYFRDGWLERMEGGLSSREPLPDALISPPREESDSEAQPQEVESLDQEGSADSG